MTAAAVTVRERPILFSGPMVHAILEGRKSQTRRVVKPRPHHGIRSFMLLDCSDGHCFKPGWDVEALHDMDSATEYNECIRCPYGQPGDRLWVRETCLLARDVNGPCPAGNGRAVAYAADGYELERGEVWTPSIFMPRWASRITLEVTSVRVERVQEIAHRDALAEGVEYDVSVDGGAPLPRFRELWDTLNAARGYGWDLNPWVWVIEFRRVTS